MSIAALNGSTRKAPRAIAKTPVAQAIALVLATGGFVAQAHAQQAFSPAWFANKGTIQGNAAATGRMPNGQPAGGLPRQPAGSAHTQTQQSMERLSVAAQAIALQQALQVGARNAAAANPSGIPDGLGAGGLQMAGDAIVDPGAFNADDPRLGDDNLWLGAHAPGQVERADGQTTVTIDQTQSKAILTWESFNVGRNTELVFDQKGNAEWVALNRVNDPHARPSEVQGRIQADGSVYVINRNGIIFGGTSQVNVHSLIASTLDFAVPGVMSDTPVTADVIMRRNQKFVNGILSMTDNRAPPVAFGEDFRGTENEDWDEYDGVVVEAGARLASGDHGQIALFGHNVINRGTIETPDGQALLAAGRGIVLNRNFEPGTGTVTDPDLRGYTVGVSGGGRAENDGGIISARRGNITLTGASVLQDGLLQATTGATANGSILLQAAHGGYFNQARPVPNQAFGDLILGEGSTIQILPDESDEPVIGTGSFRSSRIDMAGNRIIFEDRAGLYAPGADLLIDAEPRGGNNGNTPDDSRVYIGEGVTIDIAGLHVATKAQNSIQAELRANELRDNPLLRDGQLRGRRVWFDPRRGTAIADLTGYYDLIERDVGEMMTVGGTLTMNGMEIVAREGSVIDLSGGSVFHDAGHVRSSRLIGVDGLRVPIELADPNKVYIGIEGDFIVNHARWGVSETFASPIMGPVSRYEQAYHEGRSAGGLIMESKRINSSETGSPAKDAFRIFEGEVRADVTVGDYQREASTGATIGDVERIWRERPQGGTLVMGGRTDAFTRRDPTNVGGNVTIGQVELLPGDFAADTALDAANAYQHVLPAEWFDGGTFTDVTIRSGYTAEAETRHYDDDLGQYVYAPTSYSPAGILTLSEGVTMDLGDYGSLSFLGTQANIDGTIRATGGTVRLETVQAPTQDTSSPTNAWADLPEADRSRVDLGETGVIDVSGRWVNDFLGGPSGLAPVIDGGSVELVGYNIELGEGSRVSVDGGGHLNAAGTELTRGNGGSILIDNSARYYNADPFPTEAPGNGALILDGELTGYALGRGGSLTIDTVDDVVIGDEAVLPDGALEAGVRAPKDLYLAQELSFLAGEALPFDAVLSAAHLSPGDSVAIGATPRASLSAPITVEADWVLPTGVTVRTTTGQTITAGGLVPAGTQLHSFGTGSSNGALPAGFVAPADAFPDGIPLNAATDIVKFAGTVLSDDLILPQGSVVPRGTRLDYAVDVLVPRHFAPDFFTRGGFSGFAISGARGVTVTSGTIVAPSTDTIVPDGMGRGIATGSRLAEEARLEVLSEQLRGPMALSLSTAAMDLDRDNFVTSRILGEGLTTHDSINGARNPGDLAVEAGAEIRMDPGSTVLLNAYAGDVAIDGTIDAPGGLIGAQTAASGGRNALRELLIGESAKLLAPGHARLAPDGFLGRRQVESGGRIELGSTGINAWEGLERIRIAADAVLDVSGVRAEADFLSAAGTGLVGDGRYEAVTVDGAAGALSIMARRGLVEGDLRLAPGGETGHGGDLTIQAIGADPLIVAAGAGPDMSSVSEPAGVTVFADRLNASGADQLTLRSGNGGDDAKLLFDGDVSLRTRRSIVLDSPIVSRTSGEDHTVELDTGYFRIGPSGYGLFGANQSLSSESAGAGALIVRADLIDIGVRAALGCPATVCGPDDSIAAGGFASAQFISTGDIRLTSGVHDQRLALSPPAGFASGGELIFDASQIYVTSRVQSQDGGTNNNMERSQELPGFLLEAAERIEFRSNGAPAPTPLSFGERLTVRAPEIVQGGVLRAPQGQIRLEGSESVTLLPGSLTSASLDGRVVPFGYVDTNGGFAGYLQPGQAPVKAVRLDGPDVSVEEGAVIDVSGGGDLLGLAFGAGNGGSTNMLAHDPSVERFAILPGLGSQPAPLNPGGATSNPNNPRGDGTALDDPRLSVGDVVWLEAAPGLEAGYYTLLPAFYAALAGGMLIEPVHRGDAAPMAAPLAAMTRADGAVIASGYRAVGGTPIREAGYSSFALMDREVFGKYSLLTDHSFNEYAKALGGTVGIATRTPFDAGSVILGATETLLLEGQGRFGAGEDGLLGNLDVSAQNLAVVSAGAAAPEGFVALDAQALSDFGAASVLIGGVRSTGSEGTHVAVNADHVIVANDASSPLSGQELILAARGRVLVEEGGVLIAGDGTAQDPNDLQLTGDGALLRLSSGDRVGIVRTGGSGASGDLLIGNGAQLSASGSLTFDSVRTLDLAESAIVEADQLDLATVRVNLGEVPEGEEGTNLSLGMIERLGAASDLLIRGHESIHLFGALDLGGRGGSGTASLGAITFDTALFQGRAQGGETARITAGSLTLRNSGGAREAAPEAGPGALALDVDTLILGPGEVDVAGYARLSGNAGVVEAQGAGGLDLAGDLSLATGRVTAGGGADYGVRASGDLAFIHARSLAEAGEDFGGRLALEGRDVHIDTNVALPAGVFEVRASGDLALGEQADLDLGGVAVDFRDVVQFASGGIVRLAAGGDLDMADGATIDVSGSDRGGGAGQLVMAVGGVSSILGTLRGDAGEGFGGGGVDLDSGSVSDFAALNARLNGGGFDSSREIRLRDQSILLAAGERIEAHEVTLRSDSGEVRIAGTIAAGGATGAPSGGEVRLIGGNGVALEDTARIEAAAAAVGDGAFTPSSGSVELVAHGGRVDVAGGALIDVSGGREGGGRITVRADRQGSGIAVGRLDGEFRGAREKTLVGMADHEATRVDAALASALVGEASSWLAGASARAGWRTGAGINVHSTGDLTVSGDIDLAGRLGAGHLDLSAAGDLTIDAAISDGFSSASRDAALLDARSASYAFESGGGITLAEGAMVRTGTGDIRVDAGQDLTLEANDAVVYTAGRRTTTEAGFDPASTHGPLLGEFPTLGGDIVIDAGRDILAPMTQQSHSAWLFRYGHTDWTGDPRESAVMQQTSWSIVFKNFEQGIGALGGGDVRIDAGRDARHLAIALPTTGHMSTSVGQVASEAALHVRGGGDLALNTGRDLLGGVFMLGRGRGEVHAGGDVIPSDQLALQRNNLNSNLNGTGWVNRQVGALFGLMDAEVTVTAVGTVDIEAAYDPMRQGQICENFTACTGQGKGSAFYGYGARAALNATSASGTVTYRHNPWASTDLTRGQGAWEVMMYTPTGSDPRPRENNIFGELPGTLRFTSLQSSLYLEPRFAAPFTLAPAPEGTIEFLAQGDIRMPGGTNGLVMQDTAPEYRRGALRPFSIDAVGFFANTNPNAGQPSAANNWLRGFDLLHGDDPGSARVYALEGSICSAPAAQLLCQSMSQLSLPKPLRMWAGQDIRLRADIQHNRPGTISFIAAGRDLVSPIIGVTGEGTLFLEAGRDILKASGFTVDPISSGAANSAQRNLALPQGRGADITVLAGAAIGIDWEGFAGIYLDPANRADPELPLSHPSNEGNVVHTYEAELAEYLTELGYAEIPEEALLATFMTLSPHSRRAFLQRVFFEELKITGLDYNDPESPRFQQSTRGYDAVARLFTADPETIERGGNIILNNQPIETREGGDITILAPYGGLDVGSLYTNASFDPNTSGIVTRRGGDVRIMTNDNIDLFTSRVFTLQGGDVLMWTSNGDITAGAGAKTSVRQAPLTYALSNDGFMSVDVFGLQTGAGIGVLDALDGRDEDRPPSRMDLLAFRGEVNAGDAGIRVVGDLNIAALRVVGADNIQVTDGEATGIPVEAPVNVAALTSASAAASSAVQAAQDMVKRQTQQSRPSVISVEVLGFGEPSASRQGAEERLRAASVEEAGSRVQVVAHGRRLSPEALRQLTERERALLRELH
ncbi:filamentous haemagglutinin family protein [Luteimonas sp. R10]|uniref:filamentous haemagglutinin family protein n=1 Tax=Luteimonas sp. R10 TaxID=3108176 RepID=UPI00308F037C|nr:filamentous hemagglutinin family protein [Luteimonas sp. R10]